MTRNPDILFITEYIKNVLYFATTRPGKVLLSTPDVYYFSIDDELVYENYYSDFGPLNLGCVYRYCNILSEKLKQHKNKEIVVHYTSLEPKKKSNAAFLIGCYGILYLNLSPRDAIRPLNAHGQIYRPFQDATQGDSMYTITLMDCFCAITKARSLGFFNFQDFNYEEYDRLDKIQGGDLNWLVPAKFLAFIGPVDYSISLYHPPEMYIDYFKENNVKIVIRLNKRMYDGDVYNNAGITHYDLFFPDGSCPPRHILMKFLQIAEEADGAIAVHCKAGLGRTGSLIGCYLIKHYRMTAHEAIGWMRICRPGSVIGHQQGWLEHLESWLLKQGNLYRKRMFQDIEKLPVHEFGVYSIAAKLMKQRPVVFNKASSHSPLPPMQRPSRSNTLTASRAQAAKTREAPCKTKEPTQLDRQLKPIPKMTSRGSQHSKESVELSSRTSGAGEPRTGPPRTTATNLSCPRNNKESVSPIPTFRTTQGPVIKTLSDAKTFLMKSSLDSQQREKDRALHSSMLVTPLGPTPERGRSAHSSSNYSTYNPAANRIAPSSANPQRRRLPLGRSPSPSPSPSPTRGTTTTQTARAVKELALIREALSNLNKRSRKPGSIGAASVGASSLGACRDAPAVKPAPSVRSDERPLATQGDMLNSIKFQRRFRDTINTDKASNDKGRLRTQNRVEGSKANTSLRTENRMEGSKANTSLRTENRMEGSKAKTPWRHVFANYTNLRTQNRVEGSKANTSLRTENRMEGSKANTSLRTENRMEGSKAKTPWRHVFANYTNPSLAPYCSPRPLGYLPDSRKLCLPRDISPSSTFSSSKDRSPSNAFSSQRDRSPSNAFSSQRDRSPSNAFSSQRVSNFKFNAPSRPTSPKGRNRNT